MQPTRRRTLSATRRTVSALGVAIAGAGVEHGVGEILQGDVPRRR
jgi:hypothetical protein